MDMSFSHPTQRIQLYHRLFMVQVYDPMNLTHLVLDEATALKSWLDCVQSFCFACPAKATKCHVHLDWNSVERWVTALM